MTKSYENRPERVNSRLELTDPQGDLQGVSTFKSGGLFIGMRNNQRGNIFAMLFGAVALTGVLAAVGMQTLTGPVTTITRVTQKNMAETNMLMNARIIVNAVPLRDGGGDPDDDGVKEAEKMRAPTGNETAPANGGILPTNLGLALTDPWGSPYGYCTWDHGTVNTATDYITGDNTNPTSISIQPFIAVISAGPDRIFQTACPVFTNNPLTDFPMNVPKAEGSDDLVVEFTYDGAAAASNGLWTLDSPGGDVAQLKDAANNVQVTIDRAQGIGDFPVIKLDTLAVRSGSAYLTMDGGIKLDDQTGVAITCNDPTFAGVIRYNTAEEAMEVCNGTEWVAVGRGLWETDETHAWRPTGNVGIGTATPAKTLDVVGSFGATGTADVGGALTVTGHSGLSTLGTSGAASVGGTLGVTGNASMAGTLGVSGHTNLSTVQTTGTADVGGALGVTGNTALAGTLGVTGHSSVSTLDSSGAVNVGEDLGVTGDTSLSGTLDVTGDASMAGDLGVTGHASLNTLRTTGDTNLVNNALFVQGTTGRVGIGGVSAPVALVEVDGGVKLGLHSYGCTAGTHDGTLQYNAADSKVQVCIGGIWSNVSSIDQLSDIGDVSDTEPQTNQILTWNGSEWTPMSINMVGNASISVPGADGSVQFKSGSGLQADAANLHWNDVDDRLGIRTNDPDHNLHVVGTTMLDGTVATTGNAAIGGAATITDSLTVDGGTLFVDAANNRVGIGTLTPRSALHVVGAIKLGSQTTCDTGGLDNGTLRYSDEKIQMCLNGEWVAMQSSDGMEGTIPDAINCGTDPVRRILYLQTISTTAIRYGLISGAQGFGATVSFPNASTGTAVIDNPAGWASLTGCDTRSLDYLKANNRAFYLAGGSGAAGGGGGAVGSAAGSANEVQFRNAVTGELAADAEFVYDAENKRLGVGTSSPDTALHVNVTSSVAAIKLSRSGDANVFLAFDSSVGLTGIDGGGSGGHLRLYTNGTPRMYVSQSGNVGIGTSNPDASSILDVFSADKGFLPPRVAGVSVIVSPAAGLMAYDTTTNRMSVYNGTTWLALGGGIEDGVYGDILVSGSGATWTIRDSVVTTVKINDAAVTAAKIATGAVETAKIADSAVSTAKIADDAVTFVKMQDIATNSLLGRTSAGTGDVEAIELGDGLSFVDGKLAVDGGEGGVGNVVGPSSSTDNAVVRWDGATGKLIQNSNALLSDVGLLKLQGAEPHIELAGGVDAQYGGYMILRNPTSADADKGLRVGTYGSGYTGGTFMGTGAGNAIMSMQGGDLNIGTSSTNTVKFGTNSVERMRITPDGRVQIGEFSAGTGATLRVVQKTPVAGAITSGIGVLNNGVITANGTYYLQGLYAGVDGYAIPSGVTNSGYNVGLWGNAVGGATHEGTLAVQIGGRIGYGLAAGATGTVNDARGLSIAAETGAGTILKRTGLYIAAPIGTGATVNEAWAIRSEDSSNSALLGALHVGSSAVPNVSSVLEISSTTKGFLPPRMTGVQRDAIAAPATGLVVYDTTANAMYMFNGTAWVSLADSSGGVGVSDGNKGDVTVTGSGATWTVNAGAITSAKISDGTIATVDMADGAITTVKIANGAVTAAKVEADALDFSEFKDAMTLDASTDILVTGTNVLSITNTGTGNSLVVRDEASDATPFVIDASGKVGVGIAAPSQAVDVSGIVASNAFLAKPVSALGKPKGLDDGAPIMLGDLADVEVDDVTDGQTILYNSTTGLWEASDPTLGVTDGNKGDVTVSAVGMTWTVNNGAITSAKISDGTIATVDLADASVTTVKLANGAVTAAKIAADSLDFTEFKDVMTLDASTDIMVTGSNVLSITNTGTGNSLVVRDEASDATPFVIDASGKVGVGIATPTQAVDVVGKATANAFIAKPVTSISKPKGMDGAAATTLADLTDVDVAGATNGQALVYNSTSGLWEAGASGKDGDIVGPASSTDNAVVRWDGTTGKLVQNSTVIITDDGKLGIGVAAPAQALDLVGSIKLANTTSGTSGVIYKGTERFIHNFSHPTGGGAVPTGRNVFVGLNAGNFTMGATATQAYNASTNTGIGYAVLQGLTLGDSNVAIGAAAFNGLTEGVQSVAVGVDAGRHIADGTTVNTSPKGSVFLGFGTKASIINASNEIVIGRNAIGQGANSVVLGHTDITKTILRGNVGIGTTSPATPLHVLGGSRFDGNVNVSNAAGGQYPNVTIVGVGDVSNVTPHMILRRARGTHASQTYPLSGDVLGVLRFVGTGSSMGADIQSQATVDYAENSGGADLRFYTQAKGANTNTERMRILDDGRVYIGSSVAPSASAILDVGSTTQGFLPPRMTTAQRTAIATPAAGLQVYDSTLNALHIYNGTAWVKVADSSGGVGVSDGNKGDVTVSASGATWTVNNGAITSAKISDGTIATADMADGAITTVKLANGAVTAAKVADDALDFAQFKDAMVLDASTDISVTGSNVLSITNTGTGNSFVVRDAASDTSPFVIDADGKVGVGVAVPTQKVDVDGKVTAGAFIAKGIAALAEPEGMDSGSGSGDGTGVTDGNKGDITVSSTGATWEVNSGAITSAKISDGTIATVDMADGAITTAKLADGAVTAAKVTAAGGTGSVQFKNALGALDGNASLVWKVAPDNMLDVVGNVRANAFIANAVDALGPPEGGSGGGGGGKFIDGTVATNAAYMEGNVGIGTLTPAEKLVVNGNVLATQYLLSSDARLKDNVQDIDGLDIVMKLRGTSYVLKASGAKSAGVIAQELEAVMPDAVKTGNDGMKAVEYNQILAVLIEAVKDLKGLIDGVTDKVTELFDIVGQLRAENDALKAQNAEILKRLEALEAAK